MDSDRLQQIFDYAGQPGVQAFRFAVRRAGLQLSETEAKAFVGQQATGQIFQGRIPSDGKVAGGGREDMRWQMGGTVLPPERPRHIPKYTRLTVERENNMEDHHMETHHA